MRNGIGCQADTCSCWHLSHVTNSHKKGSADVGKGVSMEEAKVNCGNKNGMYLVQVDAESIYRLLYKGCFGCLTDSVSDIKLKQVLKKHSISCGHSTVVA